MFGVEGTDNLHFAVYAKQLGAGLDEQLEKFIREHHDTRLIIIDTLQKIREVSTDAYSYANDYDNILTRRLNVKAGELLNEHGIEYTVKRTRSGSFISLARKAV